MTPIDPLDAALTDALAWARREQRPISVWMHQDRFSLRVQATDCPGPNWLLIKTVHPDENTGDVLAEPDHE